MNIKPFSAVVIGTLVALLLFPASSCKSKQEDTRTAFFCGAVAMCGAIRENPAIASLSGEQQIEAAKEFWRRKHGPNEYLFETITTTPKGQPK